MKGVAWIPWEEPGGSFPSGDAALGRRLNFRDSQLCWRLSYLKGQIDARVRHRQPLNWGWIISCLACPYLSVLVSLRLGALKSRESELTHCKARGSNQSGGGGVREEMGPRYC